MNRKHKAMNGTSKKSGKSICGWCGSNIGAPIVGGTTFEVCFGYGSMYDTNLYLFEICDRCFEKYLMEKASKKE